MGDSENKMKFPDQPLIIFTKYSPHLIVDLENLKDAEGNPLQTEPVMSLFRCTESGNKPFCDGTHRDIKFDGSK